MIVKEKDAYSLVCPYKITSGALNDGCLGSGCMAWRWAAEANPDYVLPHVLQINSDPRTNLMYIRSKTHGYCGLAGQA